MIAPANPTETAMRRIAWVLLVACWGCAPKVGSTAWCERMDERPKSEWSAKEAADYARHCIFRKAAE